jgi:hypothetical protein
MVVNAGGRRREPVEFERERVRRRQLQPDRNSIT